MKDFEKLRERWREEEKLQSAGAAVRRMDETYKSGSSLFEGQERKKCRES
jgi:hypothetical protein